MKSPRTGYHEKRKSSQRKHRVLRPYPRRARYYPPGDSTRITRGLRGYTHRVRLRAPSGELTLILPLGDSTQITRGLGGYTHRVRSRAPSGELTPTKSKHPPGDSAQTTRGLRGYCREPNTGLPKEMELNNHRTLKTPERTRAPLRFLPERWEFWFHLARCPSASSASPNS